MSLKWYVRPRLVALSPDASVLEAARAIESNKIGAYTIANGRVTWRNDAEDLDISLEVTNLFDKYYFLTINDQSTSGLGYTNGQPARPREWAVSVKKKF